LIIDIWSRARPAIKCFQEAVAAIASFLSCMSNERERGSEMKRTYTRGKTTDCLTVSPSVSPATPSRTDRRRKKKRENERERERERNECGGVSRLEPRDGMTDNSVQSIVHLMMDLFSTILYSRHFLRTILSLITRVLTRSTLCTPYTHFQSWSTIRTCMALSIVSHR